MKENELREHQANFELSIKMEITKKAMLKDIEHQFVTYFNINKIKNMTVEDYVLGLEKPEKRFNFCYGLETQLKGLGWMVGGTSKKFGFYYGKLSPDTTNKFRYTKLFGNNSKTALAKAKELILDLLEAGKSKDLKRIEANRLSPMFKGKILCTYYPKQFLNIFAKKHLDHFLSILDIATIELKNQSEVWKREVIMDYKKSDKVMKDWSVDIFSDFLYKTFPIPPKSSAKKQLKNVLKDYLPPIFPATQSISTISLTILPPHDRLTERALKQKAPKNNPDYEKQSKRLKLLGSQGEELVMNYERKKLLEAGHVDKVKKVKKITSDSEGYDISSFTEEGMSMQIEVKTTSAKVGQAIFFLSSNELNQSKILPNYYIYMIFEVLTVNPKLWIIKNPFHPANSSVVLSPVNYRVQINAEAKIN
ncbi:MAG: DUF3883 domain-containing protein [Saprospiraceae bacterium]